MNRNMYNSDSNRWSNVSIMSVSNVHDHLRDHDRIFSFIGGSGALFHDEVRYVIEIDLVILELRIE